MDEKEYKHNQLLRDLELKSLHIESIENMLRRKDQEIENLKSELVMLSKLSINQNEAKNIESERKYNYQYQDQNEENLPTSHFKQNTSTLNESQHNLQNQNNNLYTNKQIMSSSGQSFRPNEENEKELRKLIDGYNVEDSSGNYNTSKEDSKEYGRIISRNSNAKVQKVPGKIYSLKKN